MRRSQNVLLGSILLTSALLVACSGGAASGGEDAAPFVTPTQETVAAQAATVLTTPGTSFETMPSTTPGIALWTFYESENGIVAVGTDDTGTPKAEVAMLSASNGSHLQVTGTAYTIADELQTTPADLLAGLEHDIGTQPETDTNASLIGAEVNEVDGLVSSSGTSVVDAGASKSLVQKCGTSLVGVLKGALVAGAGVAAGAGACYFTAGLGCAVGTFVGRQAVVYGVAQLCPNLPITALKVLTPTPAM